MATETNVEIVRAYMDAFDHRDADVLGSMSAPGFEYRSILVGGEAGIYRGNEGILRYLADIDDTFEEWRTEDSRYVSGELNRVLHLYRLVAKGRESGVPIDSPMALVWTVEDGKVKLAEVFQDQGEAARAAGVDEDGDQIEEDA